MPSVGPGTDPGFWSGGFSGVLTPRGGLSPKFAQNRDFPLKLPEKCTTFEEILGARGGPGPLDQPLQTQGQGVLSMLAKHKSFLFHEFSKKFKFCGGGGVLDLGCTTWTSLFEF